MSQVAVLHSGSRAQASALLHKTIDFLSIFVESHGPLTKCPKQSLHEPNSIHGRLLQSKF